MSGFPCPSRPSQMPMSTISTHNATLASKSSKSVFIGLWTVLAKSSNRSLSVFIGLLPLYIGLYRSFSDHHSTLGNERPTEDRVRSTCPSVRPSVVWPVFQRVGQGQGQSWIHTIYMRACMPCPPDPPCPVVLQLITLPMRSTSRLAASSWGARVMGAGRVARQSRPGQWGMEAATPHPPSNPAGGGA